MKDKTNMDCARIETRLRAYLDGETTEENNREIRGHLRACPGCSQKLRLFEKMTEKIRLMEPQPLAPGFTARLRQKLQNIRGSEETATGSRKGFFFKFFPAPPRKRALAMAGSACLVIFAAAFLLRRDELREYPALSVSSQNYTMPPAGGPYARSLWKRDMKGKREGCLSVACGKF